MRTGTAPGTVEVFSQNATIDRRRIPMRITTFLNRTIGLPGLWVKGVRIEGPGARKRRSL